MGQAIVRFVRVLAHLVRGVLVDAPRANRLPEPERAQVVQRWSLQLLHRAGVQVTHQGQLAPGSVLVVSNHVSWLDIAVLHAAGGRQRFVAKAQIGHWLMVGRLAHTARTLFIVREQKRDALRVLERIREALGTGDAVTLFPEGTTGPGPQMNSWHANLLQAAITAPAGAQVQPVVVRYSDSTQPFSPAAAYINNMYLVHSALRVLRARSLSVSVTWLPARAASGWERRALALALAADMQAVLDAAAGAVLDTQAALPPAVGDAEIAATLGAASEQA